MLQVILKLFAPADKRSEILDVVRSLRGPTEFSFGCRGCQFQQDINDENALTYVLRWETESDLIEHIRSERFRRLLPYIDLSVNPPEVEVISFEQVGGLDYLLEILQGRPAR